MHVLAVVVFYKRNKKTKTNFQFSGKNEQNLTSCQTEFHMQSIVKNK